MGGGKNISLKESNPSDIPPEILEVLGAVDWNHKDITPELIQKIIVGLKQYMFQFLPLKGQ